MAWAEPRGKGRYRGGYRDRHGKQQYLPGTYTDPAEARRKAAAKENEVRQRITPEISKELAKVTVTQWVESYWADRRIEPGTLVRDTSNLNVHITPYWGDWPVYDVTRDDVVEWVEALRVTRSLTGPTRGQRLKPSTIRRIFLVFSGIFTEAITGKLKLPYSPCVKILLPKIPPPDEYFLTRDEYDRLLSCAPDESARMFCELAVGSGMRYGELMGLHRSRIDLVQKRIIIHETYDQIIGDIKAYPKSAKRRGVPITDELAEKLRRYMAAHPARPCPVAHRNHEGHEQASCGGSLLLLSPRDGTEWRGTQFRQEAWLPMVRGANLEKVRPHDLRHTYASWLIQGDPETGERGLTLDEVCELLGHSSVLVTRRYAHLAGAHWDRTRSLLGDGPDGDPTPAAGDSAPILLPTGTTGDDAKIIPFDRIRRSRR